MDFVDEQDFMFAEAGENRGEIARSLQHRTGGRAHRNAQLLPNDVGQRRFAESWWAVKENVIERFSSLPRGGNRDLQVRADALLADVIVQRARTQPGFVLRVFLDLRRGDNPRIVHQRQGGSDALHCSRFMRRFYETERPSAIFAFIFRTKRALVSGA